ncbi:MAG TPA: hypothetical protein PKM25_13125, partial [Candidatus Ozemobacteraceae bacterium]|nr:hypothetical protein [Candidatus Ozemobacteraceae bacterium]
PLPRQQRREVFRLLPVVVDDQNTHGPDCNMRPPPTKGNPPVLPLCRRRSIRKSLKKNSPHPSDGESFYIYCY